MLGADVDEQLVGKVVLVANDGKQEAHLQPQPASVVAQLGSSAGKSGGCQRVGQHKATRHDGML